MREEEKFNLNYLHKPTKSYNFFCLFTQNTLFFSFLSVNHSMNEFWTTNNLFIDNKRINPLL